MIGPILRKLLPLVLKEVASMIQPLQRYAFESNELDREVEVLNRKVLKLEVDSHPQGNFSGIWRIFWYSEHAQEKNQGIWKILGFF